MRGLPWAGPASSALRTNLRTQAAHPARLIFIGIVAVSLLVRLWLMVITPFSYDETHNLMIGTLAAEGYAPYRQIYSVIAPFALLTMRFSAWLWGATPAVRLLMIAYGLFGIMALYTLVQRHSRAPTWTAAGLAALIFSFSPPYLAVSTSLNLEAGALAFALLAMVGVDRFRTAPHRWWWLLLAGMSFGLSFVFKIFVPYGPGVIALQLMLIEVAERGGSWRSPASYWRVLRQGLICAAGVVLVTLFFFYVVDGRAYFEQVVASRFELREAIDSEEGNIAEAIELVDALPYLLLLPGAILGVVAIVRRRMAHAWVWVGWAALAALFLTLHDPVRPRHLVTMLPALAALCGMGIAYGVASVRQRGQAAAGWTATGIVAAGVLLLPVAYYEKNDFVATHPVRGAVAAYVTQTTLPDDCVIAKENRLHFLVGRLSTPHLSILSSARLFSGLLPAERIMQDVAAWECPVLVYTESFDNFLPALRPAASDYFSLHLTARHPQEEDYEEEIFAVGMDTQEIPPAPRRYQLDDQFRLASWALTPTRVQPGAWVYLASYWTTLRPPDANYKIFVHWIDAQGQRAAAFDHYPFEVREAYQLVDMAVNPRYLAEGRTLPGNYPASGMLPTRLWLPGHTLKETFTMQVPPDLAPGEYEIRMGMYDEASMAQLGVFAEGDPTNLGYVTLGTVRVE